MSIEAKIRYEIFNLKNDEIANHSKIFFKTGKGEYGEGDLFLGVRVPVIKKIAKKHYKSINFNEIVNLLKDKYHEIRLLAIFILIFKYEKSDLFYKEQILNIVLENIKYLNNWDIVDTVSPKIIGNFLYLKNEKGLLFELAKTNNLWTKRIAIISTLYFIKNKEFNTTLKLIEYFLQNSSNKDIDKNSSIKYNDKKIYNKTNFNKKNYDKNNLNNHDLIQKACGWMLREIGKIDYNTEYNFLKKWYKRIPRTMLRYAIEKFDEKTRKNFLNGTI